MSLILPILQAFISFQCLFAIMYLVASKKLDRMPNKLVLTLFIVLAVQMSFNLGNQFFWPDSLPPFSFGLALFYGPVFYLYLLSLIYQDFQWTQRCWWHLAPGIACTLSIAVYKPDALANALAILSSLSIYTALSFQRMLRYQQVIRATQSEFDRIALGWVMYLLVVMTIALVFNIATVVLSFYYVNQKLAILSEASVLFTLLIMVNSFLLKGLLHPEIFAGINHEDETLVDDQATKYQASALDVKRQQVLQKRLLEHMDLVQPYLNPMFNIKLLSRQLGEPVRHVSQVINTCLNENFSDFVSRYRIEHIKTRLLDQDETRSITDLYQDFGFSTKSNFNRAFKKHTGVTPSDFRKS
ncbi:helix-turn-helix domain-containing protein [Paraglaciecola sp. 25GB23A]|uniref:helix-turn-helix domain-containing protein n=1 Tax=Paraglaciecola sp. 25GB23A TaxID=3156068 RepID=UPI0032AF3D5A